MAGGGEGSELDTGVTMDRKAPASGVQSTSPSAIGGPTGGGVLGLGAISAVGRRSRGGASDSGVLLDGRLLATA